MVLTKERHIVVSKENYEVLQNLGKMGDSFNDVLSRILKNDTEKTAKLNPISMKTTNLRLERRTFTC